MATAAVTSLFNVAGKHVLVTGGSRGIGFMIAKGFAENGAKVIISSRSKEACEQAADKIGCMYYVCNVATREGCVELAGHVSTCQQFGGRLDVLVNNAGTSWGEPLERESGKANWGFDKVFDLNVKSIFYLTRECMPFLERKDCFDPGRVINIGSITGFVPQEAPSHAYDVSKAAVHHLTRKMSNDLAKKNITVNALAPGYVPTRMSEGLQTWGASMEKVASQIPLGRLGNENDMVGACIYLSSKASSWVTGTVLNVDGGAIGSLQIPLSSL
mmetsp:Transcript_3987/g.5405  ORF Transcript_3987/g.5405 Transcript_3987/m.5405 type:complete len:272 (-) Transcript_3987:1655-2470(-)|eukprot:CAMPEP_0116067170 /NCGR_PEP_ID=MMETSP0322-20121206/10841_1 /TAXON_ID=163516 /ORGANISM="Leptocylindrus danicus var. apora, Strain B651" /LENGTH=271 /DNA_ID=CAMNT_0003553909 /DNA_START=43 /DNA_END=858 /DNA_ORIENTATION=+